MSTIQPTIHSIVEDQTHGSSVLLQQIIEALDDASLTNEELTWAFDELAKIDHSMTVVHHFIEHLRPKIGRGFSRHLHSYMKKWSHLEVKLAHRLTKHLNRQKLWLLTHSHSGMVIETCRLLAESGYEIRMLQTESNPGCEGVLQAKELKELGISVQVVMDDNVWTYLMDVDAILLGTDQFDRTSFINKVGSRSIVDAAARFDVPVYVLGDSRKGLDAVHYPDSPLFERVRLKRHVTLITEQGEYQHLEPREGEEVSTNSSVA